MTEKLQPSGAQESSHIDQSQEGKIIAKYEKQIKEGSKKELFKKALSSIKKQFGQEWLTLIDTTSPNLPYQDIINLGKELDDLDSDKELQELGLLLKNTDTMNKLRKAFTSRDFKTVKKILDSIEDGLDSMQTSDILSGSDYEKLIQIFVSDGETLQNPKEKAKLFMNDLQKGVEERYNKKGFGKVLSSEVVKNMAIGSSLLFFERVFKTDNKNKDLIKHGLPGLIFDELLMELDDKIVKMQKVIEKINKNGGIDEKGKKNPNLYDPTRFKIVFEKYIRNQIDDKKLEELILENKGQTIHEISDNSARTVTLDVNGIKESIEGFKNQGHELISQNTDAILSLKGFFESLGAKDLLKFIQKILVAFGFKNGFADLEKTIVDSKFKFNDKEKDLLKGLFDSYQDLSNINQFSQNNDLLSFLNDNNVSLPNDFKEKIKAFNIKGFKESFKSRNDLDKSTVSQIGGYYIPNTMLNKHATENNIDILSADKKSIDSSKLSGINIDKLFDSFMANGIKSIVGDKDIVEKITDSKSLAYMLYVKAIKPEITKEQVGYALDYKSAYGLAPIVSTSPTSVKPEPEAKPNLEQVMVEKLPDDYKVVIGGKKIDIKQYLKVFPEVVDGKVKTKGEFDSAKFIKDNGEIKIGQTGLEKILKKYGIDIK